VAALVAVAAVACGGDPQRRSGGGESRYRRPDVEKLLETAVVEKDRGMDAESVRRALFEVRNVPASQALWASVAHAESLGVTELYGVESLHPAESGYRALIYVVLKDGSSWCLFADEDVHAARRDIGTVPAAAVGRDALEALRRRFAAELPLRVSSNLVSDTHDGGLDLLHAFVSGASHSSLWYAPDS
jgi:hypothetical protein